MKSSILGAACSGLLVVVSGAAQAATVSDFGVYSGSVACAFDCQISNAATPDTETPSLSTYSDPIAPPITLWANSSTSLGSNHAGVAAVGGYGIAGSTSRWYDQGVITGGTGDGTAQVTMQIHGRMVQGGSASGAGTMYLYSSSSRPDLASGGFPYCFGCELDAQGATMLGSMGFATGDYNATYRGGWLDVNLTLQATLNFTYDVPFYLIGGLDLLVDGRPWDYYLPSGRLIPRDVATSIDFMNSAYITGFEVPEGAVASFVSGTD